MSYYQQNTSSNQSRCYTQGGYYNQNGYYYTTNPSPNHYHYQQHQPCTPQPCCPQPEPCCSCPGPRGATGATGPQGQVGPTGPSDSRGNNIGITLNIANQRSAEIAPNGVVLWDTLVNQIETDGIEYDFETGQFRFLVPAHYFVSFWINVNPGSLNSDFVFAFLGTNVTNFAGAGAGSNSGTPTNVIFSQAIVDASAGSTAEIRYLAPASNLYGDTPIQGYITIFAVGALV